jgi:hypothetical protein
VIPLILLCCLSEPVWYDALPDALPDALAPATETETLPIVQPEVKTATDGCATALCRLRETADPDTTLGKSEVSPAPALRRFQPLRNLLRGRR